MKKAYFTFIALKLNNENNDFEFALKDLIVNFNECELLKNKDDLIIKINDDIDDDLKLSINALIQDIDINIKMFEGIRLRNIDDMLFLVELFNKYNQGKSYMNISDLALLLNEDELKKYKDIVLNVLFNDIQLEQLIYGMFENNLNVSKTSEKVYMHRNTVINKLDLIRKETGLDIQKFNDAVIMYYLLKRK